MAKIIQNGIVYASDKNPVFKNSISLQGTKVLINQSEGIEVEVDVQEDCIIGYVPIAPDQSAVLLYGPSCGFATPPSISELTIYRNDDTFTFDTEVNKIIDLTTEEGTIKLAVLDDSNISDEVKHYITNRDFDYFDITGFPGAIIVYTLGNILNSTSGYVEGVDNLLEDATNGFSHVEGERNKVYGGTVHAEGFQNTVELGGHTSHVEGWWNTVKSAYSHAEGYEDVIVIN